jgi:phage terminase small subunit
MTAQTTRARPATRSTPGQPVTAGLSGRRAAFVREYIVDMNATAAYIRAGYKNTPAANKHAHRLLKDRQVQAAIAAVEAKAMEAALITIQELEQQLERFAHFDIRTVFNADGTMKLPTEWDDDAAAAIEHMTVEERVVTEGQGRTVTVRVKNIRRRDPVTPLIVLIRRRELAAKALHPMPGVSPENHTLTEQLAALDAAFAAEMDDARAQRSWDDFCAALEALPTRSVSPESAAPPAGTPAAPATKLAAPLLPPDAAGRPQRALPQPLPRKTASTLESSVT